MQDGKQKKGTNDTKEREREGAGKTNINVCNRIE